MSVEEEGVEERWKREVVEGGRRWGSVSSCRVEYCWEGERVTEPVGTGGLCVCYRSMLVVDISSLTSAVKTLLASISACASMCGVGTVLIELSVGIVSELLEEEKEIGRTEEGTGGIEDVDRDDMIICRM